MYFVPINKVLSKTDLEKHPSGSEFTKGKPTDAALLGALWPRLGEILCLKNATQYSWKYTTKDLRIGQPYSRRKSYQHKVLLVARFFSISPASSRGKLLAANVCG